ncbi:MAG: tyrosine/phenylalanine carboxypeptidase domain-containing protein [Sphingomicrobium sp.]
MTTRPRLMIAPEPFVAQVNDAGSIRQSVGANGRVHVDRPSFFLVLHRTADPVQSLARHVAVTAPSYLIWGPDDDHAAASALTAIVAEMRRRFGHILIVSLYDQKAPPPEPDDTPHLPPFIALVGPSDDARAAKAADVLGKAMAKVRIDLRKCQVEHRSRPYFEPSVEALVDSDPAISHFSLGLPQIHLAPDGGTYPQLFRDLSFAAGDALLRAACAFASDGTEGAPAHYRALGRRAFLAAALKADGKLDRIARSFDFLLSVSPINTDEAMHDYFGADGGKAPRFRYRPLEVDPDIAKRSLYAIDLAGLEDPLLETLLAEKRREIDHQLTMLATRNTPAFRPASMMQYGVVEPKLLDAARAILTQAPRRRQPSDETIGASEVAKAAHGLIARYREADTRFAASVEIRDDLAAGLMVSGGKLMISSHTRMARHRLDALLAHEISVHLLTWFNGATQGLGIFRTGLARYEGVQEGLGVFAEWAVGGLTVNRLRLLAGRVVAVDAMIDGADFVAAHRLLVGDHGIGKRTAFGIVARVYRSGGFAKDAIYLRGFKAVIDLVAAGVPLDPFWLGKIAPAHLPVIEELLQRGLLHAPIFLPEFLGRPDTSKRIDRLRGRPDFGSILSLE